MNMDRTEDKKVLDILMDDSLWLKKIRKEKETQKEQEIEEKIEVSSPAEVNKDSFTADIHEKGFGEVDYAILKSITYDFKTIRQISSALQIRTIVVEKHIYDLIKEGFIKYFQYCVLTSKGKSAIEDFEKNNPEDVWKPIDDFIVSIIERKKTQNLKIQKIIDMILLISIIILIILIIYFGIFS